jgi:hypothetical protein
MHEPLRLDATKTPYELRFMSLGGAGLSISVPCDEHGIVDLDQLDDGARRAYFYAHILMGRDFAKPTVCNLHQY